MKDLSELETDSANGAGLVFEVAAEKIDLALAVEVGAVAVEYRVDRRRWYATEDECLSVEFGVAVEEPTANARIVYVVAFLRLQV